MWGRIMDKKEQVEQIDGVITQINRVASFFEGMSVIYKFQDDGGSFYQLENMKKTLTNQICYLKELKGSISPTVQNASKIGGKNDNL